MTVLIELRRQRQQRMAAAVHALGARVVFELLEEIGRDHGIAKAVDNRLEHYPALDRTVLGAVRADESPPQPVWLVHRR